MERNNASDNTAAAHEAVIILHGLAAHWLVMSRMASTISAEGYHVINWGYHSIWSPIEYHARRLRNRLADLESNPKIRRIHLVTHSMGSIVTRVAILPGHPQKLGRIVMLGPPNHGSHIARRLSSPLGWMCPPLSQLSDRQESFVNQLPEPQAIEIGVIAAAKDLVVPRDSTLLSMQRDWIVLPGHHGLLPLRRDTTRQVLAFLRGGRFTHRGNAAAGVSAATTRQL